MMENKTAVEWLSENYNYITWLRNRDEISPETADRLRQDYLEQAKQMEKEQIDKAHHDGYYREDLYDTRNYYNDTYGSGTPELRYKDGTPMRKYNSPKLQELEQINQDNPMTKGSTALVRVRSSQAEILAEESWEGCDSCTEQDEIMYKNGYVKGYNAATAELPKEILEEAAENYGWKVKTNTFSDPVKATELAESAKQDFIEGAKWMMEKQKQKQALVDIMEEDAKNGLYDQNTSSSSFQYKEKWNGWIDMKRIEEMKKL